MQLNYDLSFEDLYSQTGISNIHKLFCKYLNSADKTLYKIYSDINYINHLTKKEQSELIIAIAPILEDFIVNIFKISDQYNNLTSYHNANSVIIKINRLFIQRKVLRKYKNLNDIQINIAKHEMLELFNHDLSELNIATFINKWIEQNDEDKLNIAEQYCAYHYYNNQNQESILYKVPDKSNVIEKFNKLSINEHDYELKSVTKHRNNFNLTDNGQTFNYAQFHANYCIHCHKQDKDSCSKGFKDNNENFKNQSEINLELHGCPLEEKISESNLLRHQGNIIASLAVICIDNPLAAATGHRICNDCMKSCIYQKQEPVDIPQIESRTLKDVLHLDYGFEIYSLLTKWNPLSFNFPYPMQDTGKKILVVGMGPAGFTLSHYLLNSGHQVLAIDGLKIEPFPKELYKPIKDISSIYENLDERIIAGFGGVAEYGITPRWDKNNLKIIRMLLQRRKNFYLQGGIKLGSNINIKQAFSLGFDHIALCTGAGKPNLMNFENALAKGIRTASDFLMSLQLTGAGKKDSISNLQIRLPLVVIGGGLTAIDAATEALCYYPIQVEKFLSRIEKIGIENLNLNEEETIIANEFITHAKILRAEKQSPKPNIIKHLKIWGGVRILYRKKLTESPTYRLNHEELLIALKEGFVFTQNTTPIKFLTDKYGSIDKIIALNNISDLELEYKAKTILVAAGTSPNVSLAREEHEYLTLDGKFFQAVDDNNDLVKPEKSPKPNKTQIFTNTKSKKQTISFFGDLHPSYAGNVVKAMASAKNGYQSINQLLGKIDKKDNNSISDIIKSLTAEIYDVKILSNKIVEIVIKSPLAAKNFKPGQFYKLQNFDHNSLIKNKTKFLMEPIAVTGAWVDKKKGLISTIILEMGGSTNLCRYLKKGEEIVLMGPTGTPTKIEPNKNIMLIGGGLGNAVLFSIGQEFKKSNSKVLYFAGYKKKEDLFKQYELEKSADKIIWTFEDHIFDNQRKQDFSFKGNVVESLNHYAANHPNEMKNIDKIIVIGSDKMMHAIKKTISGKLNKLFSNDIELIASINSPMQCMMKEICGQCIQKHVKENKEYYVYSCTNQDQCLKTVDFEHLDQRLSQNSLQEKLTSKWTNYCLQQL